MSGIDPRVSAWLEEGPTAAPDRVLGTVLAHVRQHPRGPSVIRRCADALWSVALERPLAPTFRLGLVIALLIVTFALAGAVFLGALHPPVLWPSPTPSPMPAWASVYVCPAGSHPDEPGPVDQARPPVEVPGGPMVADARSGLLVLIAADWTGPPATNAWTFDVCTNTWRQSSATVPGGTSAYDPVSDRTFIFGENTVVALDADTDMTTTFGDVPFAAPDFGPSREWHATFDSVSRRFWVMSEADRYRLWTYDPNSDTWDATDSIGEIPSNSSGTDLYAYDEGAHLLVNYRRGTAVASTYEIDPRTATWLKIPTNTPLVEFDWGDLGDFGIAYDAAIDRTLVFSRGKVVAYDARAETWETLDSVSGEQALTDFVPAALAYDPVNERIVAVGARGDGVVAFDPSSRTWTLLLAPSVADAIPSDGTTFMDRAISAFNEAADTGDTTAAAELYTAGAIREYVGAPQIVGREAILADIKSYQGYSWSVKRVGAVITSGDYYSSPITTTCTNCSTPEWSGVAVVQVNNGKIVHEWIVGH